MLKRRQWHSELKTTFRRQEEIKMKDESKQWHWQESGTAWKGVGIYHVTLTVPSREPLLGKLVNPAGHNSDGIVLCKRLLIE